MNVLAAACAASLLIGCAARATGVQGATFTTYPVPFASPHGIVYDDAGPLKGVWFTNATLAATSGAVEFEYKTGKTAFLATPSVAAMPGSINYLNADRSLWFTETNTDKIATIDPSRKVSEYAVPTAGSKPLDITRGPDGAMWFTESAAGRIGRVDPRGKITEFLVGPANDRPTSVIAQDGALWFTEVGTSRLGRLTTSGDVRHFAVGSGRLTGSLTNTNDGSLWAGKHSSVVRVKSDGSRTEFTLPDVVETGAIFGRSNGVFIGALKSDGQGAILSVSDTGQIREYDLPRKHLLPIEMAIDPDGGFFMTVDSYPPGQSVSMVFRLQLPEIADLPKTTIVTGGAPDWMVTGGGALWISNITLEEVERVDAGSLRIVARIKMPGVPCSDITYGFTSVWVPICSNGKGTSLVRIDARTDRIAAVLPIPPADSEGGITVSTDAVWMVTTDGMLSRIDPATNAVRQKVRVAAGSANPRYDGGLVWLTSAPSNELAAIDASTGKVLTTIAIRNQPHFVTTGAGAVWTIDQGDGSVTRVDMQSKKIVAVIDAHIPGSGGDAAFGAGSIWITLVGTPLTKIDTRSNEVVGQWFGPGGDGLTFGYGFVWLVDYNHGIVWRLAPTV